MKDNNVVVTLYERHSNFYAEETLKNFNSEKDQHTEEIKNPKPGSSNTYLVSDFLSLQYADPFLS
ncbi:hypothetical protein BpHYR1_042678 [Brachionus plicatilis]|uniref:Uncharacterized protein n=1 Tax=Brachionus plicatilis TaxID=10195 RepID=A0A3M7QQ42_BRAPC|nr:hypothetical protein BpHYR1_042678 [Brachionus plicatilis]